MFPIQLDKTFLDFGVDSHKQCPINTVLTDVLVRAPRPSFAFFALCLFVFALCLTFPPQISRFTNVWLRAQMLENTGREKVEFRFHHTLRNHKMSLLFTPNRGTIKPGKVKEIKVELVMKITTTINEPVVIEAVGTPRTQSS